ncbi:MAG: MFS transporter [Clostridia bacterium]|nr:MFS transporter [Clostridia bacterium]
MKLNFKRTICIGLAFMVISVFWGFYDQAISYILKYEFGQAEMETNLIMSIDNVLALFLLPIFGALSDKTNTPYGKRTPYIVVGTVFSILFFIGMGFGVATQKFWLFFAMLFMTLLSMATFRSPAVALMPDLTPRGLRSRANAIINIMGGVGSAFAMLVIMVLVRSEKNSDGSTAYIKGQNYWPVMLTVAGFMLVGLVIFLLTIKEKKLSEKLLASGELTAEDFIDEEAEEAKAHKGERLPRPVLKSLILILLSVAFWYIAYNGMSTNLSRYCQEVMGKDLSGSSSYSLVTLVVTGVAMVPLFPISAKFGRKKTIIGGVIIMMAAFLAGSFIRQGTPEILVYGMFSLVGIGWAAINVNSYPMVVEISRAGDVGKYTGYYYTFSMAAQVVTPLLSALLIETFGLGYTVLFPYSAIFCVLALVCMFFVKHGEAPKMAEQSKAN